MSAAEHPIVWLSHAGQRLGVLPSLGGGVAAWQWLREAGAVDLWRPWDGARADRYTLACFPLVPWSNRISAGGFEHDGRFHPIAPNRAGEPYPIHGDGWLQRWDCARPSADTIVMTLVSERFDGDPYVYAAEQRFTLVDGGMDQSLEVTHLGESSLPYGLGLHPYFPRDAATRIAAPVTGLWLSGADPLPIAHTSEFPPTWNIGDAPAEGDMIDNCYTGWSGEARVLRPTDDVQLLLRVPETVHAHARGEQTCCLLYRPPRAERFFCFEPITHPIDAFHLPGRPGLAVLSRGQRLALHAQWRFGRLGDTLTAG